MNLRYRRRTKTIQAWHRYVKRFWFIAATKVVVILK